MSHWSTYPSRTLCAVLEEMRACYKTCNFGAMPGLIEEAQIMGNRMEARLQTAKDYFSLRDDIRKENERLKELKNEVKLLEEIKERTNVK